MRRRDFLTLGAVMSLGGNNVFAQTEQDAFAKYKQQQQQAFNSYKTELLEAFAEYQRIHNRAFSAYSQGIANRWQQVETSDPTKWVTYDSDLATKVVVDYRRQNVRIESVLPPSAQQKMHIEQMLQTLNQSSLSKLIQRDPVDRALNQFANEANEALDQKYQAAEKVSEVQSDALKQKTVEVATILPKPKIVKTSQGQNLTQFVIPLSTHNLSEKEQRYLHQVQSQAKKWHIDPSLVMAVTRTESAFNPLAKSAVPAYGLMQIVPRSAGMDATQLIYGHSRLVSPNYLYTPENNIQMGSAYLHILQYRYLKRIQDPQTRLYCTIAAYNTGAGNVARAITGRTKLASLAEAANSMTPQRVHNRLMRSLPYDETKHYLERVLKAKKQYQEYT